MALATASLTSGVDSSSRQGHVYRSDIDGLRAIAIIAVVAFHARLPFFSGGFVGVDIFLVISGYLIGSLVYREVRAANFRFLRFYERRAKRILPALLTVLLVCNLIAFVLLSPFELRNYCGESFSAVLSSSNIYFWLRSNYFSPVTAFKPLLMTWSLGVEEQFYLLFPLLLVFLHRFANRNVLRWVAVFSALSLVAGVVCTNFYPSAAFYLLPMRAWELGLGILIAIHEVHKDGPAKVSPLAASVLGWLGLALIIAPVLAYSETTRFPGFAAVLPTVGTACLINSRDGFVNRSVLSLRPIVFVGLVSYSWYLWHWPLMSFARIVTGNLLSVPRAALIAAISFVLATLSYRFIEQPFRKSVTPAALLLLRYGALVALLASAPLLGYVRAGWPGRMPELMKVERTVNEAEHNVCLTGFDESAPRFRAPCMVEGNGPRLVLWGDSHAAALAGAMQQLAVRHGYGFEQLTKASCPPLPTIRFQSALRPTFEGTCTAFNRAVLQQVRGDSGIPVLFWLGCGLQSVPTAVTMNVLLRAFNPGVRARARK
jgi:peptidoglycan/LPS O-acetylase OafA/YrhL